MGDVAAAPFVFLIPYIGHCFSRKSCDCRWG